MAWVRGIDACKAGWLEFQLESESAVPEFRVIRGPAQLRLDGAVVTAIDIPIGLPARERRACDQEARRRLKARRSSVFPAPVRAILDCHDYGQANRRHREIAGRGLSRQAFALLPKIRDVDGQLRRPAPGKARVFEVHPELSFACWNAGEPMRYPKHTGYGFVERYELVRREFPGAADRVREACTGAEVADDDILDALAALWTARRLARGQAVRMDPGDSHDPCGLLMNIWA